MPYPNAEDVLLKSRMRENFTSGSVRGLIVTSEPIPHQEVGYELYSTICEERYSKHLHGCRIQGRETGDAGH